MTPASRLLGNVKRHEIVFERGEGVWLYDDAGRRYLDMLAGVAVNILGHAHPDLTRTLREQAERLLHVSNLFRTPQAERAGEAIVERLGPGMVYFANSGTEANEAAIKLVRKHAWRAGEPGRVEIVALEASFHGRTFGSLAATMQPKKWEGFQPLPGGFRGIPVGDLAALDAAVGSRTAAVFIEPIQGEGGIRPLDPGYARAVREVCTERGALLVCDEIQTGVARTGRWWGFEHLDIRPDVVTLAKGLSGGVPAGAMWVDDRYAQALQAGDHSTTVGGGPLAGAAICTVLDVVDRDGLVDHARELGARIRTELEGLGTEVRGWGLLLAVDLGRPVAGAVVAAALARGLIVNDVTPSAIRVAPPLVITEQEAMDGIGLLRESIEAVG